MAVAQKKVTRGAIDAGNGQQWGEPFDIPPGGFRLSTYDYLYAYDLSSKGKFRLQCASSVEVAGHTYPADSPVWLETGQTFTVRGRTFIVRRASTAQIAESISTKPREGAGAVAAA